MGVNEIAAELRDQTNTRKSKEQRCKALNQLEKWLQTEVEPDFCKQQNDIHTKFKINEIDGIKKQIKCSLSLIDSEVDVNVENASINHQASFLVVIIVGAVYPLKSWLFALINAITSGSCVLVQFDLSGDFADLTLIENLFKPNYFDEVRSFLF